jgi:hypothetical protein
VKDGVASGELEASISDGGITGAKSDLPATSHDACSPTTPAAHQEMVVQ